MKAQTIIKSIYMVLTLALVFGFTLDTGNSNTMLKRNDAQLLLNQGGKKWVAPPMADKLTNPLKGNKEATEKGKDLFQTNCFTCHGENGHGNGPGAAALNPKPANLTSKEVHKQSDGAIYYKITTGFPPTAMISWRSNLSEKQRWELVNYIRELDKK
jgi:mono/diheme cytochrome c family protein